MIPCSLIYLKLNLTHSICFYFVNEGGVLKNNLSLFKFTSIRLGSKGVQEKSDIVILYNIFQPKH